MDVCVGVLDHTRLFVVSCRPNWKDPCIEFYTLSEFININLRKDPCDKTHSEINASVHTTCDIYIYTFSWSWRYESVDYKCGNTNP